MSILNSCRWPDTLSINVIEIEGLLFPGFGQILAQCALHGKLVFPVFPIKWLHEGTQKWSSLVENFWAPSWHHLMGKTGKTSFPWSARIGPKPGNSKPSISITLLSMKSCILHRDRCCVETHRSLPLCLALKIAAYASRLQNWIEDVFQIIFMTG